MDYNDEDYETILMKIDYLLKNEMKYNIHDELAGTLIKDFLEDYYIRTECESYIRNNPEIVETPIQKVVKRKIFIL